MVTREGPPGPNPLEIRRIGSLARVRDLIEGNTGQINPTMGFVAEGVATAWTAGNIQELEELIGFELGIHNANDSAIGKEIVSPTRYKIPRHPSREVQKQAHVITKGKSIRRNLQQFQKEIAGMEGVDSPLFLSYQEDAATYMAQLRFAMSADTTDEGTLSADFNESFDQTMASIAIDTPLVLQAVREAEQRVERRREDLTRSTTNVLDAIDEVLEIPKAVTPDTTPPPRDVYTRHRKLSDDVAAATDEIKKVLKMSPADFVKEQTRRGEEEDSS